MRAYNFCALTLLLALCSYGVVLAGAREHGFLLVLAITVIGLGLGALWEIGEFAYDRIVAPPSSILAKFDTIMDMLLDTGGALVAGLLLLWMLRKHEQDTRSRRRREITKVLFFDLDGSLTEARVPFAVAGFVLFLVAFVGGHVGAGRTNPDQKGAAL